MSAASPTKSGLYASAVRLLITLAVPACLASSAAAAEPDASADSRPNVVLIIADDHAWTDYGFMGHPHVRTPHLDRLARESLVLPRGYVPSSLCRPSLASIITGLYPHQHRIVGNDPPPGTDRRELLRHIQRVDTLAGLLGQHGYRSLQTGKWWEGNYRLGCFTHGMTHGDPDRGGRHGDEGLAIGRNGMQAIFDFIDGGQEPFFLWYAPMLPHRPHNPPAPLLEHYRVLNDSIHVARYWAMIEWFDATCGELLAALDERGLTERTLVAFIADNGWIQDPERPEFAPRSKRSPYDGGLRTPIMLRWPGRIQPQTVEVPVSSIDLAPTILRLGGIDPPAAMPGRDLMALAQSPRIEPVVGATFDHDIADPDRPEASLQYRWIVRGRWKLIRPFPDGEDQLFDLEEDPMETRNLAVEHPDIVRQLAGALDRWWNPERTQP